MSWRVASQGKLNRLGPVTSMIATQTKVQARHLNIHEYLSHELMKKVISCQDLHGCCFLAPPICVNTYDVAVHGGDGTSRQSVAPALARARAWCKQSGSAVWQSVSKPSYSSRGLWALMVFRLPIGLLVGRYLARHQRTPWRCGRHTGPSHRPCRAVR